MSAVLEGAQFLVQQPLAWLVLATAALLACQLGGRQVLAASALFAAATLVCLVLPPAHWQRSAAAAAVALGGAWAALGRRRPVTASFAAAGLGGVALGWAASLPLATAAEAVGIVGAAGALLLLVASGLRQLPVHVVPLRFWQVGTRIAGSWLAAIGLLLLALSLARPG